jgi:hypothetical protein
MRSNRQLREASGVAHCYYHLLAARLPQSRLKSLLAQLVNDERAHLHFHCTFLRLQSSNFWRQLVFRLTWRTVMLAAAVVVLIDHRHAIRDLDLTADTVWRRWMTYSRLAERLVLSGNSSFGGDLHTLEHDTGDILENTPTVFGVVAEGSISA